MADSNQIRINELARELEVKAKVLIEFLPEIGVTEKKTHSSSLDSSTRSLRENISRGWRRRKLRPKRRSKQRRPRRRNRPRVLRSRPRLRHQLQSLQRPREVLRLP